MSDISHFTGKFRVHGPEADRVVKRPRATLTCAPCRQAKLGCDKKQPCSSCVKRGDAARCTYGARPEEKPPMRRNAAEQKLAHLESMVRQLMQEQRGHLPSPPIEAPSTPAPLVKGSSFEAAPPVDAPVAASSSYAGSTHWSAMLEDIHELRGLLDLDSANVANDALSDKEPDDVIYGQAGAYSIDQIIANHMPSIADIDGLLNVYFSGETFILPVLHTSCFQRQCDEFWKAPSKAQPLWLSMLFSLCFMAAKISASSGSAIIHTDAQKLQTAAGQCLVLGQYNIPQRYAPEALLLYAQSKHFHGLDPSPQVGAILAMSVRHGYRMGYHRDPDVVGSFSPFEGEMRRRFWATCKQMDLMISFQLGLPSNIRLELCDSRTPRNLLDSDFDENSTELPPSRSETEATRFLWFIVKDRQMPTFSRVCQNALSCNKTSYENVQLLDAEVRRMHASIPLVLQAKPLAESATDSPFLVMTRLYIKLIHLKSLCVLHRSYIPERRKQSVVGGGEAAQALLTMVLEMYDEFVPGGQLQSHKWMLNCFTVTDFLFGVTTACLAVRSIRGSASASVEELALEQQLVQSLHRALKLCSDIAHRSHDARRVSHAVRLVLDGLGSKAGQFDATTVQQVPLTMSDMALDDPLAMSPSDGMFGQYDPFDFVNNPIQDFEWAAVGAEYEGVRGHSQLP